MSVTKKQRRDPHAGRPRDSKIKTGNSGGPSVALSVNEKVQLGKGLIDSFKHVPCPANWSGARGPAADQLFDPVQSRINKDLGYW